MKSVPIIFLIFMFIILTIPAYAADTKKITSVNIQRIYKAKEGEINPDQVSFKPGRSEYTITYQGMYDASDLPIGEYSCAMKSHFRKFGNQMSGSGNHLCNYASLLA